MTARHEALAFVELADATIRRAWDYQATWIALEQAQVPAKHRIAVLDRRLVEARTEALERVDAWAEASSDVPLVLEGGMGNGKSFAAARWLTRVVRRGQSAAWLSATALGRLPFDRDRKREQDRDIVTVADEERRVLKACAVVVDDLGAGVLSSSMLARVNGLLLDLEAAGVPVLVLLNTSKEHPKWAAENIDRRLRDRMRTRGVGIVRLAATKSMREASDADVIIDKKRGRGRAWQASAALLRTVGVVDDFDNSQWDPDQQRTMLQPVFGHALTSHALRPDWDDLLERLCRDIELDPARVRARGDELERIEAHGRRAAETTAVDLGLDRGIVLGASGFLDQLAQEVAREREAAERRFARPVSAADLLHGEAIEKPRPQGPEPTFVDGERQRLFAMGYRVHHRALDDEFELRHTRPHANGRDPKRAKQNLLGTYETEARAWDAARRQTALDETGAWQIEKATA